MCPQGGQFDKNLCTTTVSSEDHALLFFSVLLSVVLFSLSLLSIVLYDTSHPPGNVEVKKAISSVFELETVFIHKI